MSVLRQLNLLSQMRLDIPHLRSAESAVAADFDVIAGRVTAGGGAYVVRGFEVANNTGTAVGLSMGTADGVLYNLNATESGTFLWTSTDRATEVLNPLTNSRIVGSWTPSATNYVGIDYVRLADTSTTDLVQFLDPNTLLETPKQVPLAKTLDYRIVISILPFGTQTTIVPIAVVTLDSNSSVTQLKDARPMLFRLGSGGDIPNYQNSFVWAEGRSESTTSETFAGGDKYIGDQKAWMDAVMTRLWELGSGENWYSPTADRNVKMTRDSGTVFDSTGDNFEWDGVDLHWQGLSFIFDNSNDVSVYYNTVANKTGDVPGLTDLLDGQCVYVDLDRTSNAVDRQPAKSYISQLGTPSIPGSRYIFAWRLGSFVFTRDTPFPVNYAFIPATTTALGAVRISRNFGGTDAAASVSAFDPVAVSTHGGTIVATGTNKDGLKSTGIGTGRGLWGVGGAAGAVGVFAEGTLGLPGVLATGGATGHGVIAQGGVTSGDGIQATGGATGHGVVATGGSTGGCGVSATSTGAFAAVYGQATDGGSGRGGEFYGADGSAGGSIGGAGLLVEGGNAIAGNTNGGPGAFITAGNSTGAATGPRGIQVLGGNALGTGVGGHGVHATGGTTATSGQISGDGVFARGGNAVPVNTAGGSGVTASGGDGSTGSGSNGGRGGRGVSGTGGAGGTGVPAFTGGDGGYGGYFVGGPGGSGGGGTQGTAGTGVYAQGGTIGNKVATDIEGGHGLWADGQGGIGVRAITSTNDTTMSAVKASNTSWDTSRTNNRIGIDIDAGYLRCSNANLPAVTAGFPNGSYTNKNAVFAWLTYCVTNGGFGNQNDPNRNLNCGFNIGNGGNVANPSTGVYDVTLVTSISNFLVSGGGFGSVNQVSAAISVTIPETGSPDYTSYVETPVVVAYFTAANTIRIVIRSQDVGGFDDWDPQNTYFFNLIVVGY